jgi:hypothetical protein
MGISRYAAIVVLGAALLPALACESDSSTRPPVIVVTPQPVRGVIAQTSFGGFQPRMWVALPIEISQRGVLDITADWLYPDSWIYMYFGNTKCDYEQLANKACPFLIASETQLPKPRVFVTGTLDPGTYYLVFYNVPKEDRTETVGSYNVETISLVIGLTINSFGQTGRETIQLGRPVLMPAPHL